MIRLSTIVLQATPNAVSNMECKTETFGTSANNRCYGPFQCNLDPQHQSPPGQVQGFGRTLSKRLRSNGVHMLTCLASDPDDIAGAPQSWLL